MEPASYRQIRWIRRQAVDGHKLVLLRKNVRDAREQAFRVGVARVVENMLARYLLNDLSCKHDRNIVEDF